LEYILPLHKVDSTFKKKKKIEPRMNPGEPQNSI